MSSNSEDISNEALKNELDEARDLDAETCNDGYVSYILTFNNNNKSIIK